MKTTLVSLLTAAFLGYVSRVSGLPISGADLIAVAFAVGLTAWTVAQYSRKPRPLSTSRPIHVTVSPGIRQDRASVGRLAA